jgi:hypothetical protein
MIKQVATLLFTLTFCGSAWAHYPTVDIKNNSFLSFSTEEKFNEALKETGTLFGQNKLWAVSQRFLNGPFKVICISRGTNFDVDSFRNFLKKYREETPAQTEEEDFLSFCL